MARTGKAWIRGRRFFLAFLCVSAIVSAAEARPRLVSLAPSLTEMVFAIGAGDLLVGVTNHCRYPPAAAELPKVGDYQMPNFEAIIVLQPDLVLVLAEHSPSFPTLDALGMRYERFDHRTLAGLLDSFTRLGEICAVAAEAVALRREMEEAFSPPVLPAGAVKPRMLVVFGRDYGQGGIANAYAIGRDGLYERLIEAVGCDNAYAGTAAYPVLSGEGVAALNPDIIVETVYTAEMGTNLPESRLRDDWEALSNLPAVRDGRLFYIMADYVYVPGARMLLLKRDFQRVVAEAGFASGREP